MRKRYYLSFDLDDPRHREAERLFTQQASRQRTEYVVTCILASDQTERMEQLVRQAVREELKEICLPEVPQPQKPNAAVRLDELPSGLIHALEEL